MATPAEVTAEAQRRASQSGRSAQEELWNYATSGGMDAAGIDAFMGYPPGTAQTWAVSAGKMPAPQGNSAPAYTPAPAPVYAPPPVAAPAPMPQAPAYVPPAPVAAPVVAPVAAPVVAPAQPAAQGNTSPIQAQRDAVIAEAQARAAADKTGKTAQEHLWDYAISGGMDAAGIDSYMGWPAGTSQTWAVGAGKSPAPQTAAQATPAQAEAEAHRRAALPGGKSAQEELWNFATTGGMSAADIDKYMGYAPNTAQTWAVGAGKIPAPQGNSGALTTTAATTPAPTPPGPLTTATQPDYKMPVLNALYQGQQQRMFSPAPTFNFQQAAGAPQPPQPGFAAGAPQGALTTAISAP